MKKLLYFSFLLCLGWIFSSHVGSPGVIFEGQAGPHRMLVHIVPPEVIPGTASVTVILPDNPQGVKLEARPVYWSAGLKGTPKADPLLPVQGEPGKYEGELWFMDSGTSSVQLHIHAPDQMHEAIIPVMAVATTKKDMPLNLGIILSALGIFLVILLVTIIASAMGESIQDPGIKSTPTALKRKKWGIGISSVLIILLLWGGKAWWDAEAQQYQNFIFQPFKADSNIINENGRQLLQLSIDSTPLNNFRVTRKLSLLVPDHGKLMHLFLIRKGDLDVFAHLHPQRKDTLNFEAALPPLPPGDYHVFADITRYTGFAETIVSDLNIPEGNNFQFANQTSFGLGKDDTYTFSNSVNASAKRLDADIMFCGKPGVKTDLPGGYSAMWETEETKYRYGKLYNLNFELTDPDGNPALLEPYLGMMGHAVVLKHDGSVFIHLHPTGNYSMGSQQMLLERFQAGKVGFNNMPTGLSFPDSIDQVISYLDQLEDTERDNLLMGNMSHTPKLSAEHEGHSMVSFPYAFPEAGNYRVWLQVKVDGKIVNGAFDVTVE
jgi:hypothetical protein